MHEIFCEEQLQIFSENCFDMYPQPPIDFWTLLICSLNKSNAIVVDDQMIRSKQTPKGRFFRSL